MVLYCGCYLKEYMYAIRTRCVVIYVAADTDYRLAFPVTSLDIP